MVTERYFFRENANVGIAYRTVNIVRKIIASGQFQGSESSVKRKMQKWLCRQIV